MTPIVSLKTWGEFALFTMPAPGVERVGYPLMTPSAARGVLDAILYKPQMRWHVRRITALRPQFPPGFPAAEAARPYRLVSVRRNEIQGAIAPRTVEGWMKNPDTFTPYLVDSAGRESAGGQNRTQRLSLLLQHVAYRIDASPVLTDKANKTRRRPEDEDEDRGPDSVSKYVGMFERRVKKGQCFHRPYLGIREYAAHFGPADDTPVLAGWDEDLGYMLHDIAHDPDGTRRPVFFGARVVKGMLHCDTDGRGPNGEPPVKLFGPGLERGAA